MAQELETFPKTSRKTRYPWHDWTNGRPWRLEASRDFAVSPRGMRSTVITYASRHDLAVRTAIERDLKQDGQPERWVILQFFPERSYRDGPPAADN